MQDQHLIAHLMAELRHVTDMRIQIAGLTEWRTGTNQRLDSLEQSSKLSQEQLHQHSKSNGFAATMRMHAVALVQWIATAIIAILAAAKMLPPWVEKLVSVLARGS